MLSGRSEGGGWAQFLGHQCHAKGVSLYPLSFGKLLEVFKLYTEMIRPGFEKDQSSSHSGHELEVAKNRDSKNIEKTSLEVPKGWMESGKDRVRRDP